MSSPPSEDGGAPERSEGEGANVAGRYHGAPSSASFVAGHSPSFRWGRGAAGYWIKG